MKKTIATGFGVYTPKCRTAAILRFLLDSSVPVSTRTLTRAFFLGTSGTVETREKRCWRVMNRLRLRGEVGSTEGSTVIGRSPAYWYPLRKGADALVASDLATLDEVRERFRSHRSSASQMRRRHEIFLSQLKAEIMGFCRTAPKFALEFLAEGRGTWVWNESRDRCVVAPDLVAVIRVGRERLCSFVEVQGSSSTSSALLAISEKVRGYVEFLESGSAADRYPSESYRVLFVTFEDDPEGGVDHCVNVLEEALSVPGAERLVLAAPLRCVREAGFGAPIWRRPQDLLDLRARISGKDAERIADARHAGNAVRRFRDRLIVEETTPRRFYE